MSLFYHIHKFKQMQKHFFLGLVALFMFSEMVVSQPAPKSPRGEASADGVKVSYGRPSKRGREIFGALVPFDSVWRTGANGATEITFEKEMKFGGEKVKPGTYSLFTIPTPDSWTIILNTELKQWGSFGYAKIKDKDVLHIKVPVKKLDEAVEMFTIRFDDNRLILEWDKTQVAVKVK